jgi:hypothetical protein
MVGPDGRRLVVERVHGEASRPGVSVVSNDQPDRGTNGSACPGEGLRASGNPFALRPVHGASGKGRHRQRGPRRGKRRPHPGLHGVRDLRAQHPPPRPARDHCWRPAGRGPGLRRVRRHAHGGWEHPQPHPDRAPRHLRRRPGRPLRRRPGPGAPHHRAGLRQHPGGPAPCGKARAHAAPAPPGRHDGRASSGERGARPARIPARRAA